MVFFVLSDRKQTIVDRDNIMKIIVSLPHLYQNFSPSPAIPHLPFADKLDDGLWAAAHHILPAEHDCRDKTIFLGNKALLQVKRLLIPSQYFGSDLKCLTEGQRAPIPDGGGPYHHFGPQFV